MIKWEYYDNGNNNNNNNNNNNKNLNENDSENDNGNEIIKKLTKKYFFNDVKMSHYWFKRQEILQKAKERYFKEKAAMYYLKNKDAIKE